MQDGLSIKLRGRGKRRGKEGKREKWREGDRKRVVAKKREHDFPQIKLGKEKRILLSSFLLKLEC